MQDAVGAKAGPVAGHRHMAGIAAIEVLDERSRNALLDKRAQGLADVEILAGHPQRHGSLPGLVIERWSARHKWHVESRKGPFQLQHKSRQDRRRGAAGRKASAPSR